MSEYFDAADIAIAIEEKEHAARATDPNDLERHILDPNIVKSEAEWWAKRRIEELEREAERLKENHGQACLLVAKMHAAAVGEVTGPKRGVVEDVEDLRRELRETEIRLHDVATLCATVEQERDALLADNERLRDAMVLVKFAVTAIDGTSVENEVAHDFFMEALAATPAQSLDALLDPYKAHIEQLRAELNTAYKFVPDLVPLLAPSALAATPAQSLVRHDNAIREECATLCESLPVRDDDVADECATAIRQLKEPE